MNFDAVLTIIYLEKWIQTHKDQLTKNEFLAEKLLVIWAISEVFLNIYFSHFAYGCLVKPKCTIATSKKTDDLSDFGKDWQ